MLESNFWQDKANSKKVIKEKKLYEDLINSFETSIEKLKDLDDLSELALEENNEIIQNEILDNIKDLRKAVKKNEVKCFLSDEADSLDCYIEIHAGAGGTECLDEQKSTILIFSMPQQHLLNHGTGWNIPLFCELVVSSLSRSDSLKAHQVDPKMQRFLKICNAYGNCLPFL